MRIRKSFLVLFFKKGLLLFLFLSSCSAPVVSLPAPVLARGGPYLVQVGDVLGVRLYTAPELNEDITVRPDGRVTTALAQSVQAAGRTPDEIAVDLRRIYGGELKDPRLAVEVKSASPARVYVSGEVASPGEFSTGDGAPITLLQAVARAGGVRVSGDEGHVFILRHAPGNKPVVLATNYRAAASGADASADVALAPFDVVYVPRTGINQVYVWFNQHVQQFVPVSWGFSYNVNPVVNNTTH